MKRIYFILLVCFMGSHSIMAQRHSCNHAVHHTKSLYSDTIDVLHYDINLDIIYLSEKQIKGYTELKIKPLVNQLDRIPLELLELNIDSVFVNNQQIFTYSYNDSLLNITLSNLFGTQDTLSVKVFYQGNPVQDNYWGGFYFSNDSAYAFNLGVGFDANPHNFGKVWFPCIDDFHDRATYRFSITTKSTNMAVCGGILNLTLPNGNNTTTWKWDLNQDIPTYLASVAVGNYALVTDTFHGMNATIPIDLYVKPSDSANALGSFINLKNILNVYESAFGPYRWDRVGYVGVPFYGGAMEHATNIALGNVYINGNLGYETLIAHELSHHWFGDLVCCESAEDMWLNEGWAVFCEALMKEGIYGKDAYKEYIRDNHQYVLQFAHIADNGYRAVYGIPHEYTYGTTVYDKGADVVHTLRGYFGDTLFFNATKEYLTLFAFDYASSDDLKNFLANYSGIDMQGFFDNWIFSPGFPHYSIDSVNIIQSPVPETTTKVYVKQKMKGRTNLSSDNLLYVWFMDNQWNLVMDTMKFSGATAHKSFVTAFSPEIVMIDMKEKLSDATTDLYKTIKNTGKTDFPTTFFELDVDQLNDSAFVRITHNWVEPDPLKNQNQDIFRISNNRYWTVEGIFPTGFEAKGIFTYNRTTSLSNGYLDHEFLPLASSVDSLVLLYRRGAGDDWKIVNFVLDGTFLFGELTTQNLKAGEYTLGISHPGQSGMSDNNSTLPSFNVYPNPAIGEVHISYSGNKAGKLCIYNNEGKLIDSLTLKDMGNNHTYTPDFQPGIYYFKLTGAESEELGSQKILFLEK